MAQPRDAADVRLAERLRNMRRTQRWSVDELSSRSRVSRASLSRIENGEVSPTASVLGRLAGAHGSTVSRLLANIEDKAPALVPAQTSQSGSIPPTAFAVDRSRRPRSTLIAKCCVANFPPERASTIRFRRAWGSSIISISRRARSN